MCASIGVELRLFGHGCVHVVLSVATLGLCETVGSQCSEATPAPAGLLGKCSHYEPRLYFSVFNNFNMT